MKRINQTMKSLFAAIVWVAVSSAHAQAQLPPVTGVADPFSYARTKNFTYLPDGLVDTETTELGDVQQCVVKKYIYDDAGNRTGATQQNCTGASGDALFAPRSATTTYGAQTVTVAGISAVVPRWTAPSSSKNALQQEETQTVDPRFGTVLSKTDANGLTTRWEYDDAGRATREIHADGTRVITAYCYIAGRVNAAGDTSTNSPTCPSPSAAEIPADAMMFTHVEPRDASGAEGVKNGPFTRKYVDRAGRALRQVSEAFDGSTQPGGTNRLIVTDTEYGDLGQVVLQTQPYFLDSGSSTSTGSADVGLSRTEYDALGRVLRIYTADSQGSQPSVSFGTRGSRRARVSTSVYGALVVVSTDDRGQVRTEEKNVEGRTIRITDPLGAQIVHQHDAFGNLVATKDALQNTVQISYDLRGNKLKLTDPDAGVIEYRYDALGQVVRQQNPLQAQRGGQTTMQYDVLGRMTLRSEPEYQSTWTYDNCAMGIGKLCATSASTDMSQQWVYDSLGRMVSNRTTVANGPSFASALSYDANGRQATQTWPTGLTVNYGYTSKGFLGSVSLATAVTVNPLPATPGGTPGASVTLPAGTVLWQAQAYNAWDRLEQQKYSSAVVSTSAYEAFTGRASGLVSGKAGATTVLNHGYVWDSLGRLTNRNDANGDGATGAVTENFEHDALGRLQRYTVAAPAISGLVRTVSLQYNALGSILYKSDVGVYSYGAQGANAVRPHAVQGIEGAAANTYGFDANGNIASATAGKYRGITYTGFNLPDSQSGVQGPAGGPSYVWSYDEDHARIREVRTIPSGTNAGTRTTWYLHPDNTGGLAFESEVNAPTSPSAANPAVTSNRHYLSAGGQSLGVLVTTGALPTLGATQTAPPVQSSLTAVKLEYWHKDHLGSIAATTDHNGDVTARDAYDPFGKRRFANGNYDAAGTLVIDWSPAVNSGTDRGFTGHEQLDDIGLTHMNGRMYDATIGRFLSVDQLVSDPSDLQAYNRYSYVRNDPLARTDPSGWADDKPSKTWEPFKGGYFMTTIILNAPEPRSSELKAYIADAFANARLPNNSAGGTTSSTSTLASAARDTGRAAYNVGMEAHPLVSVASSIATAYNMAGEVLGMLGVQQPDRMPVASEKLRSKYESPTFGLVAEVGMGLLAGRAAGGFGNGVRAVAATAEREMFALCFVAGTLVSTSEGLKPIERIRVGDLVAARDEITGVTRWQPVVGLFHHQDQAVLQVTYVSESGEEETIGVTPEHPFQVQGRGWVSAGELVAGDRIERLGSGALTVGHVEKDASRHDTYNFEVAEFHTYFVGRLGAWVHNACKVEFGSGLGGRLGNEATRAHVGEVATEMERRGWKITGGGGRGPEEYLPGPGGARRGSSYPDITAVKDGKTLRLNTVDTRADGVTLTTREATNANRIRAQTGEHVLTIPKPRDPI